MAFSVVNSLLTHCWKTQNIRYFAFRLLQTSRISNERVSPQQDQKILEHDDDYILYSKSPAAKWKAEYTRTGTSKEIPWFQPYAVLGSVAVFLLYFCVFREESDIDKELDMSLFDRIEGLEEVQIKIALEHGQTEDKEQLELRLKQLQDERNIVPVT